MSDDSRLQHPDTILHRYLLLEERTRFMAVGRAMITHRSEGFFADFLDGTDAKCIAIQHHEDEELAIAAERTEIAKLVCDRMKIPMMAGIRKFGASTDALERLLTFYEWWSAATRDADTPLWAASRPWQRKFDIGV